MFTGIVEAVGMIRRIELKGTNREFLVGSPISRELKVDQSISHDGVCLTVTKVEEDAHWVTAIDETLKRSHIRQWIVGSNVNLERCMLANSRFDGHIVQGHIDQVGTVLSIKDENGSWIFEVAYDPQKGNVTVEKGSICVNGVSLTCFHSQSGRFKVAIIPYTFENTNFHQLKEGTDVNLEFDIIGKYVRTLLQK